MRIFIICCLLVGCASTKKPEPVLCDVQPINVEVPIAVYPEPPAEIENFKHETPPIFVNPSPQASSCLTPEGELQLKLLIQNYENAVHAAKDYFNEAANQVQETPEKVPTPIN